jgi:hypothetical protein
MADDADKPVVTVDVTGGDADGLRAALEEEGIEVREVSENPISGFGLIGWLLKVVLEGAVWDVSKFVGKRGAKGLKRLVKHLQKKSGKADDKGTVTLQDAEKTTINFESDLPDAAYAALEKLNWSELVGKTLSWRDGKWQEDDPPKITSGDDSF